MDDSAQTVVDLNALEDEVRSTRRTPYYMGAEAVRASPSERARILLTALPDRVRIGPHDFQIVQVSQFHGEIRYGEIDFKSYELRLAPHSSPSVLVDTFLHEALHGMYRNGSLERDGGDKEERVVSLLGTALTGLFRDNAWLVGWIAGALR